MNALELKQFTVSRGDITIITNLDLILKTGSITALMGPNGSGKSTLGLALVGSDECECTGTVSILGVDHTNSSPEERAAAGLFIGFQHPPAIPGVSVLRFLHSAKNALLAASAQPTLPLTQFVSQLRAAMHRLSIPWSFAERSVNDGFSGGERKRLEVLQLLVLQPKVIVLDEIDSGLDIDALKVTSGAITEYVKENPETALLLITHYQRLLDEIPVDTVHVFENGRITRSGDASLAKELEQKGYQS
jgi:Fe-S cluster assembly ATP-binding protein